MATSPIRYSALHLLQKAETDIDGADALAILRQRYARGEFDKEEFEEWRNHRARNLYYRVLPPIV